MKWNCGTLETSMNPIAIQSTTPSKVGKWLVADQEDMGRLIHVTQPGLTRVKPNQSNDVHAFKTLDACHIVVSLDQIDT